MPIIEWLRYPTDVNQSVRTITVQVQLPAGALPTDLQIVAAQTSPSVSLYAENGVVVSRTLSVPLNQFEVYLSVSTIDDHDIWVANQINPEAKQSIVVTLRDSVSGVTSIPIYIKVAPIPADVVATEKTLFADDFSGATISRENWTAWRTVAGVQAAPNMTVALSHLSLNNAAVASGITAVRSDVIEGRCHIEFRGAIESIRRANAGFAFGAYFVDLEATAIADLDLGTAGFLGFGINLTAGLVFANDPATTIHISTASSTTDLGPDIPILLPAGGVTTTAHTYTIDFDGHTAVFSIDGTVVATVTVKIPPSTAKRFIVWMTNRTDAVAPAGVNLLAIDRVDVASDERLVTTGAAGGGGGGGVVVASVGGLVQSQQAPSPSAVRGATTTPLDLEPDRALRTRARVLTDEDTFADEFSSDVRTALTGNLTFTLNSAAVTGAGTAFTTELQKGQYVELNADDSPGTPVWGQILSIESNTALTLVSVYTGAGGTGASSMCRWRLRYDAGANITRPGGTSYFRLAPGVNNGEEARLNRWYFLWDRKRSLPIDFTFRSRLDVRRANQTSNLALYFLSPASASRGMVRFRFDGGEAVGVVNCESRPTADAASTTTTVAAVPNGGTAVDWHSYRARVRADRVDFYIDDASGNWIRVASHPFHVPYPYDYINAEVLIGNAAAMGGATNFDVDVALIESLDSLKAEVEQLDETKLRASVYDQTPTRPTHGVTVALTTDNSTLIATVEIGKLYRITPIGTEGIVWTNSAGPAARATDEPLQPNQKDEFIARHASVYSQKLVAGTANGSVNVTPRDGGTIA